VLNALVVAEVALSLALLAGAGLLIRSFVRLQGVAPGFRVDGVLTARVTLPDARYPDDPGVTRFFERAVARLGALPGVEHAAGVSFLPMAGPGMATSFYRLDRPQPADGELPGTQVRPVTPGFFDAMGIPRLAGRDIAAADTADAPLVAVVSRSLAREQFPGEDPLGRLLHVSIGPAGGLKVRIVGVVGDIRMTALDVDTRAAVYVPHAQLPVGLMTFVVRTGVSPASLAGGVSAAIHAIDPELAVADVRTLAEVVDDTLARPRIVAVLLTAFALMALVLAAVGMYGVMAYSVSGRTREIGVRMALGASRGAVFRLVMGHALRLVGLGITLGIAAAAPLAPLLRTLLYQTPPLDVWTFAVTAGVLAGAATLASYVPARRGTRIPPIEALRTE
jgi:putative ABC transport system permease protein